MTPIGLIMIIGMIDVGRWWHTAYEQNILEGSAAYH